jgi:putative ABC transport system permease protein
MIKNYFKISLRHIQKNRVYSSISILGLAVGICCALFIVLYVYDELSYDKFHEKKDRIYRITELIDHNGEIDAAMVSLPVGPTYTDEYPEIENYVRFISMGQSLTVKVDDKVFKGENFWRTDSTLFDVMSYRLLEGNPNTALAAPQSIVLSKSLAEKYFGSVEEAMGRDISIAWSNYNVTGVIMDSPNSDMVYEAFTSISGIPQQQRDALNQDWFRLCCYTFLLFNEPIDPANFRAKMDEFSERHVDPFVATFGLNSSAFFSLQPLVGLHFDNSREYDTPKGNMNYLSIFILLAVFILAIAIINYVNMSLSQSIKRAKEVGVRKSLGAKPWQVRAQFLGESIIISFIALFVGLILVEVLLSPFNMLTNKSFTFSDVFDLRMVATMVGLMLLTGVLSGFYPALVLSRFQSSEVLRGSLPKIARFSNLRKVLMVLQFAFSLFMIIGTISIYRQLHFLQNKNLGFDQNHVISLAIPQDTAVYNHLDAFKDELLTNGNIKGISGSGWMPGRATGELMFRVEQDGELVDRGVKTLSADEDFLEILGIEILEGRNFSADIQTDVQQGFIINETAMRKFGWADNPIGKRIQWGLQANNTATADGNVIGVVKDFHFASLHNLMEPLVILFRPNYSLRFTAKISGGNIKESLAFIEDKWADFAGNYPLEYEFLDDRINAQYEEEQTLLKVFSYFAGLSVIIAALGLFALTSFTVEQRLKEFSIRKVLGAKIMDLGRLLSREFLILMGIAVVIVSPLAYYAIADWLQNFSYHINVPWSSFALAAVLTTAITFFTISFHIYRLSKTNPSRNLRME